MPEKQDPAFLAVIPAPVRYDDKIPANAKLLFGEITSLCGADGVCRATNAWFAELYGVTETSISRLISSLQKRGHLSVTVTGSGREIAPKLFSSGGQGVYKNVNPPLQNCIPPFTKMLTPNDSANKDNIYISNTTVDKDIYIQEDIKKESKKKEKSRTPLMDEAQMRQLFTDWIRATFPDDSRTVKNQLYVALDDFYAPRESRKQEPQHTARGFHSLCGQLIRHCKTPGCMIDALQQATAAGWKSVYPKDTEHPQGNGEGITYGFES